MVNDDLVGRDRAEIGNGPEIRCLPDLFTNLELSTLTFQSQHQSMSIEQAGRPGHITLVDRETLLNGKEKVITLPV